jgi:hypothetical protein
VIQILDQDTGPRGCGYVPRIVAIGALDFRVVTVKGETRLAVIHRLAAWLPSNKREIGSVVFGVAPRTVLSGWILPKPHGMHSPALRHPLSNLGVTFETLQLGSTRSEVVAFRAVQRPGK